MKVATADFDVWCRGVEAYRCAWRPAAPTLPQGIWQEGTTVLRDYGGGQRSGAAAPLVIVVPSLVNRATVLDLLPGRSLLRDLLREARVWLVDWQAPGEIEQAFTVDDYVARLLRVVEQGQATGRPVYLMGYCMGGLLALATAQLAAQPVDGLVTLGTPWDFAAYAPGVRGGLAQWSAGLQPWLAQGHALPVDILQTLFALMQPLAVYEKFKHAGSAGIDDLFVAVEDWLNEGVPLVARVAHTCLADWFGANTTVTGAWRVAGQVIDPARIACPALVITAEKDQLVPQPSAAALAEALPNAKLLTPALGHVGMIVGRQAKQLVWSPIAEFIRRR